MYVVSFPSLAPITLSYAFVFQFFPFVVGVPVFHASLSKLSISIISGEYFAGPLFVDFTISFQDLFFSGVCL